MSICQLKHPWEYDEVADLTWLSETVRNAFSRFSDHASSAIAFKYVSDGIIEGVGIGKFVQSQTQRYLVIGHLHVKDGCRGKGVGSAILNRFLVISAQNQLDCRLQVAPSNRRARRLYGEFDFSAIPEQDTKTLWLERQAITSSSRP